MAGGGGDANRTGPGFDLPDEILSVMPADPFDQLDLARRITSMAIASRVTNLESEAGGLRQKLLEKDLYSRELEEKVSLLEAACQDAESRLKIAQDDNIKLLKERDSFASTAKKLSRDLAKLEAFKRQLMQSLNDENSPQAETVDIGIYDKSASKGHPKTGEEPNSYRSQYSSNYSIDSANINDDASKQAGQGLILTPFRKSGLTPTGTPKSITSVSPRWYSAAGSPQRNSGHASPRTRFDGWDGSISSYLPSSQQSSTANSPPRERSSRTRIDGKEFFRQARSRLSLEQFSAFLTNIKEFNAQMQSREETLRKAEEIFGTDNKDLYVSFQGLLVRSTH
ncbi:hypothetical protein STAS_13992 [Striga asiatica]|uniref:At4g15545-like C-terminal domain-containing protein n=1 Tax=Striga asiatica TaxID=4170 RepID=A0A5A7PZM8_STRAF|nr:hypothetical protein STAS_13992 [Striga asiatica]